MMSVKMEVNVPENNADGKLPILDMAMWPEQ